MQNALDITRYFLCRVDREAGYDFSTQAAEAGLLCSGLEFSAQKPNSV